MIIKVNSKNYFVYIMTNKNNKVLYIGITNNLKRRIWEHKNNIGSSFVKRYKINKLVYFEIFDDVFQAIVREKRLKKWNRDWKVKLIKNKNPNWVDLYYEI